MLPFLFRRYLFPRGGSLLTLALWISVAGVALGVALLVVVLSVMSGFLNLLQENYTNITSEIVVLPRGEMPQHPDFEKKLRVAGVKAITPFSLGQAMVIQNGVGGVTLEGIDIERSKAVTPWDKIWTAAPRKDLQDANPNWIWLGKGLAEKLQVKVGDAVNVLIPDRDNRLEPFVVTAITKFGIYNHDLRYAYVNLPVLQEKFHRKGVEPFYKVRLEEGQQVERVYSLLRKAVTKEASLRRWSDINQNIFLAVQHQKGMLFLILEIVVMLAGMNVINLLMISAQHRKRDIAILRAMGMPFSDVAAFFSLQGAFVGLLGIGCGVGLGVVSCFLFERFQPKILSEQIYNVAQLPFRVSLMDVGMISMVAFMICFIFSLFPAIKASLQRPVEALRYE